MGNTESAARPRIAILGSCVSRDPFELPEAERLDLVRYMARSALGSFMGRRTQLIEPDYARIRSNFQRRMVGQDIAKQGRQWLRRGEFDLLVIDLIDERFPLARFPDGGIATISSEFRLLEVPRDTYLKLQPMTEDALELWKAGWASLLALLRQLGLADRVVVHQAWWLTRTSTGVPMPGMDPEVISEANAWLKRAYDHVAATLGEDRLLRVSEGNQVANAEHHWGVAPFHYVPAYNSELLACISERARA